MWIRFTLLLFLSSLVIAQAPDLIVHGAHIASMDPRYPAATAIAVSGDRILALGSDDEILALAGAATRKLDAGGAFLCPGFIDSHAHFAGVGRSRRHLDLVGCQSYDELLERVQAAAAAKKAGAWILGRGWDQNLWPEKVLPHHKRLSAAIPDHPVMLRRVDGHAALLNAAALRRAGIDAKTPNPAGGEILHDENGQPTGVLVDAAVGLVGRVLPRDDDEEVRREDLLRAQAICFEHGITMVHDPGESWSMVDRMSALMDENKLKIRLYVMLSGSSPEQVRRAASRPPILDAHDHRLFARSFKFYADGALGSRGAAMLEDYTDRPGHRGLLITPLADLVTMGDAATRRGYQFCVHAIGDRANRMVLDAVSILETLDRRVRELRPRIEHAQILDEADIPRFAELGVIAAMQGVHAISDGPWVPTRIGLDRAEEGAYVWRKLLRSGARICNGTDAPVERIAPLASLEATVRRMTRTGPFFPGQRLSRLEALATYTVDGAYAAFQENRLGRLAPGYLADFILLDKDLLTCPEDEIHQARVLRTYVAGELVFESSK